MIPKTESPEYDMVYDKSELVSLEKVISFQKLENIETYHEFRQLPKTPMLLLRSSF